MVRVDPELCIGCGLCVNLCSKVFKMTDEGKAVVIDKDGDASDVISQCPVQAIISE